MSKHFTRCYVNERIRLYRQIRYHKKYVDKIWDEIENKLGEDVKIDEATKAEKLREMSEER